MIWKDIKYALRMLRLNAAVSCIAILTLALGIAATTTVFTMVNSVLLRPLPVPAAEQITVLTMEHHFGSATPSFSVPELTAIQAHTGQVFASVVGYMSGLDGLSLGKRTDRLLTAYVTGNFFTGLELEPEIGRLFRPSEGQALGADPVIVLSYSYWKLRFAADPSVIGKRVLLNGQPLTVIGIAPKGFQGISTGLHTDAYLPIGMNSLEGSTSDFLTSPAARALSLVARLRPGLTLDSARAALPLTAQALARQFPAVDKDLKLQLYLEARSRPRPDPKQTAFLVSSFFLGLSILVLVLACVNVGNILLVRATAREREMAVRMALGAQRLALVRQLMIESIVLAATGGLAGMVLGLWASYRISDIDLKSSLPLHVDIALDWRVFVFAFGATLVTGIIVGIVPALRVSGKKLNSTLRASGRGLVTGKSRLRDMLVVAQVSGSLALLIIAGLFVRSLAHLQESDLGFNPNHVLNLSMDPNEDGYSDNQCLVFYRNLLDRVRTIPGVRSVSLASSVPFGYVWSGDSVLVSGNSQGVNQAVPMLYYNLVSSAYFETMGMEMRRGRGFADSDNSSTPNVAVISQAMAKRLWPGSEPLGRTFSLGSDEKHLIKVVGVAGDVRFDSIAGDIQPYFWLPYLQHAAGNSYLTLQLRTAGPANSYVRAVKDSIASLAPDLPVFDVQLMTSALYTTRGLLLFQIAAGLSAAMGMLGLILAVIGIYGVISYSTSQQTHQIGIRMALGAQPGDIIRMIVGRGVLIVGAGLLIGLLACLSLARLLGSFVAISATDPFTYLSVSGVFALVGVIASYIPARKALRVDPTIALRS